MANTPRTLAAAISLVLGLAGFSRAADPPAPKEDPDFSAWVEQRIRDWQPAAAEKRFDEIGWCHSILEAERLARKYQRPIFWFTHDGRMDVGRC